MTTYLRTHTLRGDVRRLARWITARGTAVLLTGTSIALYRITRSIAYHERLRAGVSTNAVGGEVMMLLAPWMLWVIWDTIRDIKILTKETNT